MNIMLDIVGSLLLASIMLVTIFNLNATMGGMTFQNTLDVITQENSVAIANLINNDFYKIGFGDDVNSNPNPIVQYADSDQIVFRSDISRRGVLDTVHYFTSSNAYFEHGSATKFRKLYRLVNASSGPGVSLGITSFKLSYYDAAGLQISFPTPSDTLARSRIQSIKVQMMVKNPIAVDTTLAATYDTTFAATYWEKWISPKNLRRIK